MTVTARRPLGPDDLVLCAGTIPGASFAERVAAAAAGGFSAISLRVRDHVRARAEGLSDADMRARLADAGIAVAEVEVLQGWRPGIRVGRNVPPADEVLAIAAAVGARSVCVVEGPGEPPPIDEAARTFGALCDRAADAGLMLHFEFFPGSALDLDTCLAILDAADRPNAGLTVDTWHLARTPGGLERLRASGARVVALQLCDSPAMTAPEPDYMAATLTGRLVPGTGALDLAGFVRAMDEDGCQAPLGAEIWSDVLARQPPVEVARRVGSALRVLVAAVRPVRVA
ncbi:MAG: sugar phosphate isomerase/epimerase [Deltaproteobacteria bacterium]|nr:sugar phosphate isomerase/epimerase [Deltaproteobacteria bacterium]